MSKKHGELKIMTLAEMIDMYCENYATMEFDFAVLDFDKNSLNGIPARYLDAEKVYEDAWGWCGIVKMSCPLSDDLIIAIGHYGSTIEDIFNYNNDDWDSGYSFPRERIVDAIHGACDFECRTHDDALVVVEIHDEAYKRAEEERKVQTTLNEYKERMAI